MKGLLATGRLLVLINGVEYPVIPKPKHVMAIQQHFQGKDPVEMERTIFGAWYVLNEQGTFPGTLDEFTQAFEDYGVEDDEDDDLKA